MARHFKTKAEARSCKENKKDFSLRIFKKLKGHKNRNQKPFVVCTEFEWLNLY